jgi:1A family penicillin-binding protein
LPARPGYAAPGRGRRGAKPLFVLRHHRPHYRRALAPSARKGGYIRTILAGLLGSTLLFLLAGMIGAGGVAWAAWSYFTDGLPSVTSLHPTEFQSTKIYDRHGGLLYEISDPTLGKRTYLGIEQLPPDLINATIAAEDASFRENAGVDLQSILRAVYINLSGQGSSGASTITMQLVRGAMLPEKDEPTWRRKIREAILANRVSEAYSKDKILEIYLNDIYYGAQAYGVAAASQVYYGVAAKDLDLAQAAMLAGLPQAPSYFDPHTNYREAKIRQEYVLNQMVKSGYITQAEATKAAAEDVHPVPTVAEAGPSQAPHFVNYVRALLDNMYGPDMVNRGGLRVFTTIDLGFQELARRTAAAQIDALRNDQASNAAVVAINPRTGEIMAMLGSIDYSNPDYGQVNVAVAPLQPGSAFKPFTYVTAFKKGYTPASMLPDIALQFDGGVNQPPYAPKDYDLKFRGPVSIRTALANSLNVPAVEMLREVGIPDVLQTARDMGVTSLNQDPSAYGLSLTLGGANVSLLDMTSAYGTFANRGVHMPAVALLEVRDGAGNILYHFDPDKAKAVTAVTPQQAYLITDILSDNKARTPLFGPDSAMKLSRPAAAKTGTTENYRDSWILGYTPDLVTGVWVGNNNGQPMAKVAGARGAGPIWHNFMEGVFADPELEKMLLLPGEAGPPTNFPEPPGLHRVAVCAVSGMLPSAADTDLVNELFIAGTEPKQECDLHKMYKICLAQSTPMLANDDCPPQFVIDRPYLVLPPLYNDWAATQPKTLFPPTATCCFPTPVPTEPPTPDIQETPVPGLVPPIQIPNPVPRITPVRDDDLPGGVVNITAPRSGAGVGGQVTITGNAAATNFDYYTVEYGAGPAPANWVAINGQTTMSVRDGVLAIWNTNGLPEGPYTLRLTVANQHQQRRQYIVQVSIERTPLKVQLTAPVAGQPYLSGNPVALAAAVTGPKDLAGVEFYVDNVRIAVDYDAPYQATWTATGGDHTIDAVAYSATGRRANSEPVQISVADPPTPTATPRPSFTILYPQDQASVNASTMNVLVAAGPGSGITRVDFYVDGWNVSTAQGQDTFQIQWQAIPGRHLIMAIGYNAGGTEVARTQVTVYTNPGP